MADLILEARRVLGDTASQAWTPERMMDIANRGMRDIARHGNMYRNETMIELTAGRMRYPLPLDILKITSLYYNGDRLPILSKLDRPTSMYASKDQINLGILEIMPLPIVTREPTMFSGAVDVGATTAVSPSDGVASNPVHSVFGVTSGLIIPFDANNKSSRGIITGVAIKGDDYLIHYDNAGSNNGVITAISAPTVAPLGEGGVDTYKDTMRMVGRRGFPTVSQNNIHLFYKSLPPKIHSEDQAFPLSPQWEDMMVDWLVGTALQDDNDAANQQRATTFIQRYTRNLEAAVADSAVNYNNDPKVVAYTGGIVKRKRRR